MKDVKAWRGLGKLIGDVVEQGASAIERVHLANAKRPFDLLKQVPGISDPVEGIQTVHDTLVASSYEAVRAVTRAVSKSVDIALDSLDTAQAPHAEPVDGTEPARATEQTS